MLRTSGYSLWLVPDTGSKTYDTLAQCIADIATKHRTPNFVPHVTLLGGVDGTEEEMRAKTQELAEKLAPYEIRLGSIASNGTYHQILFSKVDETKEVMLANATAREIFGVEEVAYFPHLSFAYGELSPKQVAVLEQEIAERGILGTAFRVRGIELWRCKGTVPEWRKIATFPFKD